MTKQTKQGWEEEFDERFIVRGKYENGGGWEDFHEDKVEIDGVSYEATIK